MVKDLILCNAGGWPDVWPLGAQCLRSQATSLSDSRLAPEPTSKGPSSRGCPHGFSGHCVFSSHVQGVVVRKSSQAMSPHCTYFVPLTQIKKASAPVFPDTNNTQNTKSNESSELISRRVHLSTERTFL